MRTREKSSKFGVSATKRGVESIVEVTPPALLKKLRNTAQPAGGKGSWLRLLSDKRLVEVYHRLRAGESHLSLALVAQKEWGIMKQSDPKSLSRTLRNFSSKVLDDISIEKHNPETTKAEVELLSIGAKKVAEKIDGMDELSFLVASNRERIKVYLEQERKAKIPFKGTADAMKLQREIIDTFIKYGIELGMYDANPDVFRFEVKAKFGKMLDGAIRDDGSRIIAATKNLLEMIDKEAIELEETQDSDGNVSYMTVDEEEE